MQLHPRVTTATIAFAARFEGLRRRAARLPGGGWTIGYGHTRSARKGAEVTEEEARALLAWDLSQAAAVIEATVFAPLDANAFDALCDFAFNVGEAAFRTSEVLRRLNEGRPLRAAAALEMWRRADLGGASYIVDAVVRRRAAEKALFLTPDAGFPPAPSSVVRPQLDRRLTYGTDRLAASEEAAVACLAPLDGDDCRPVVVERSAGARAGEAVAERLAQVGREPEADAEPPPLAVATGVEEPPVGEALEGPPSHDARVGFRNDRRALTRNRVAAWVETGLVWSGIGLIGLVLFGSAIVCMFDRATLGCVLIGVLGVLIMLPAAIRLLGGPRRSPA